MMKMLEDMKWRYATKKFDVDKKIEEKDIEEILEVGNLTATSLGMQTYKFIVVRDEALKEKLAISSWGNQIKTCSDLIVLAVYTDIADEEIADFVGFVNAKRCLDKEKLESYHQLIQGYIDTLKKEDRFLEWTSKQVYIVLGTLMASCAEKRIDSCPMEGFKANEFDEILGLKEQNLTSVLALPIGYRAKDDHHQEYPKVRKSLDDMVVRIR